jgi:hypothetical protein
MIRTIIYNFYSQYILAIAKDRGGALVHASLLNPFKLFPLGRYAIISADNAFPMEAFSRQPPRNSKASSLAVFDLPSFPLKEDSA